MKATRWYQIIGAVLCASILSFAQDSGPGPAGGSAPDVETDVIFDEILQSLSHEMKAQVDSAKRAGAGVDNESQAAAIRTSTEQQIAQREQALEELPEQLRRQVEKAIGEIEAAQQERKAQFMEQKSDKSKR